MLRIENTHKRGNATIKLLQKYFKKKFLEASTIEQEHALFSPYSSPFLPSILRGSLSIMQPWGVSLAPLNFGSQFISDIPNCSHKESRKDGTALSG